MEDDDKGGRGEGGEKDFALAEPLASCARASERWTHSCVFRSHHFLLFFLLLFASGRDFVLAVGGGGRFFSTGKYWREGVVPTLAPSMDICVSSNFERYLFHLSGDDGEVLAGWLKGFEATGEGLVVVVVVVVVHVVVVAVVNCFCCC